MVIKCKTSIHQKEFFLILFFPHTIHPDYMDIYISESILKYILGA